MRRHRDGRAFVHVSEATANLIAGEVDVGEWDDEELFRGYSRAKDGTFKGRPPSVVPIGVYQEFIRRQMQRAEQGFANNLTHAVQNLIRISEDPDVPANVRLRALEMIFDRVLGKPKERVEIGPLIADPAWKQTIDAVTVDRAALAAPEDDVVDAEIVDDDFVFGEDEEDEGDEA